MFKSQRVVSDISKRLLSKTHDKLDGFLTLIDCCEVEIAALRTKFERPGERIIKLKTSQV
jgi:hypothetical protein